MYPMAQQEMTCWAVVRSAVNISNWSTTKWILHAKDRSLLVMLRYWYITIARWYLWRRRVVVDVAEIFRCTAPYLPVNRRKIANIRHYRKDKPLVNLSRLRVAVDKTMSIINYLLICKTARLLELFLFSSQIIEVNNPNVSAHPAEAR